MILEPRPLNPSFHPYYRDQGIVLQFILSEFLYALREMHCITQHFKNCPSHSITVHSIPELRTCFGNLFGSAGEVFCQLPWNPEIGILHKLKAYSSQFAQNISDESHPIHAIHHYFHKACLSCKQAIDLLYPPFDIDINNESLFKQNLKQVTEKINRGMRRCARLLAQIIFSFRSNENIIFFLLHHYSHITAFYAPQILCKLISKMHPNGFKGVQEFLLDRYEERGFDHLLTPIKQFFVAFQ